MPKAKNNFKDIRLRHKNRINQIQWADFLKNPKPSIATLHLHQLKIFYFL